MIESNENKIVFKDVDTRGFDVILFCIYKDDLAPICSDSHVDLFHVYNLANKFCMKEL